mmetsp:Transcript_109315/g.352914  ORF Transcript_109315/g.352914 Transcript_109315/m.352914 type:complete len:146 (-) Transcript_109315:70-507(-)
MKYPLRAVDTCIRKSIDSRRLLGGTKLAHASVVLSKNHNDAEFKSSNREDKPHDEKKLHFLGLRSLSSGGDIWPWPPLRPQKHSSTERRPLSALTDSPKVSRATGSGSRRPERSSTTGSDKRFSACAPVWRRRFWMKARKPFLWK